MSARLLGRVNLQVSLFYVVMIRIQTRILLEAPKFFRARMHLVLTFYAHAHPLFVGDSLSLCLSKLLLPYYSQRMFFAKFLHGDYPPPMLLLSPLLKS